jgi:hypothetical protein
MKSKSDIGGMDEKRHEDNVPPAVTEAVDRGPSHEEIQRRAYEIHLERGARHGQDMDDWLEAERDLKAKRALGSSVRYEFTAGAAGDD